jgi:hypothetical protein
MPSAEAKVYMPLMLLLLAPPHVAIILIRSSAGATGFVSMKTVPVSWCAASQPPGGHTQLLSRLPATSITPRLGFLKVRPLSSLMARQVNHWFL